jgi:hypothetical protein
MVLACSVRRSPAHRREAERSERFISTAARAEWVTNLLAAAR